MEQAHSNNAQRQEARSKSHLAYGCAIALATVFNTGAWGVNQYYQGQNAATIAVLTSVKEYYETNVPKQNELVGRLSKETSAQRKRLAEWEKRELMWQRVRKNYLTEKDEILKVWRMRNTRIDEDELARASEYARVKQELEDVREHAREEVSRYERTITDLQQRVRELERELEAKQEKH